MSLNLTGDPSGCNNLPFSHYDGHKFYGPYPNGTCWPVNPVTGKVEYVGNYGYTPSVGAAAFFVAAFSILTLVHLALWLKSHRKWIVVIVIGGIGEVIGQIGRLASSQNNNFGDTANNYFLVQIICLTITPAFFSAACYGIFTIMIAALSDDLSRIRDKWLVIAFVGADIFSLVIQAAGGGIAAGADTVSSNKAGTHLMLAGIVFQLVVMVVFSLLFIDYFWRARKAGLWAKTTRQFQMAVYGIAAASVFIIIRGAYRTAELEQGWNGYLISHEGYFLGLDAVPMVLCLISLAIAHPAHTLPVGESLDFLDGRVPAKGHTADMAMQDTHGSLTPMTHESAA